MTHCYRILFYRHSKCIAPISHLPLTCQFFVQFCIPNFFVHMISSSDCGNTKRRSHFQKVKITEKPAEKSLVNRNLSSPNMVRRRVTLVNPSIFSPSIISKPRYRQKFPPSKYCAIQYCFIGAFWPTWGLVHKAHTVVTQFKKRLKLAGVSGVAQNHINHSSLKSWNCYIPTVLIIIKEMYSRDITF